MLMENFKLAGHQVRVTWISLPGRSPHNEQTLFRGEVAHEDERGLWLWGSFFVEKAETMSVREVPRDRDDEDRLYFAPCSSIEAVQIIAEDSKDFETHKLILARRQSGAKDAARRSP
jgi:hypothetical protein